MTTDEDKYFDNFIMKSNHNITEDKVIFSKTKNNKDTALKEFSNNVVELCNEIRQEERAKTLAEVKAEWDKFRRLIYPKYKSKCPCEQCEKINNFEKVFEK